VVKKAGGTGTLAGGTTVVAYKTMKSNNSVPAQGQVTNSWGTTQELISAATAPEKGGVAPVGRAFQKHSGRPGTASTGQASGNAAQNTQQGLNHLNMILNNPEAKFTVTNTTSHGNVLNVRLPDGMGAQWSADGSRFIMFLERYTP